MRTKLGLVTVEEGDLNLVEELLDVMHRQTADYTLTFRRLCDAAQSPAAEGSVRALFTDSEACDAWLIRWRARLATDPVAPTVRAAAMRRINPLFIPRNHRVEQALSAAIDSSDLSRFVELLGVLSRPFDDQPGYEAYALPPGASERVLRTFCGT